MRSDLQDIEVHLRASTPKAWLVENEHTPEGGVWIPKSMCEMENKRGQTFILTAPESYLTEKGLV